MKTKRNNKPLQRNWTLKHLFRDKKINALNYEDTPIYLYGVRVKP